MIITSKILAFSLQITLLFNGNSHSLPYLLDSVSQADCLSNQADRSGGTLVVNHRLRGF
jgi:hypothetical protein